MFFLDFLLAAYRIVLGWFWDLDMSSPNLSVDPVSVFPLGLYQQQLTAKVHIPKS